LRERRGARRRERAACGKRLSLVVLISTSRTRRGPPQYFASRKSTSLQLLYPLRHHHGHHHPPRHGRRRVARLVEGLQESDRVRGPQAWRGWEAPPGGGLGAAAATAAAAAAAAAALTPSAAARHRGRLPGGMHGRHGPAPAKPVVGAAEDDAGGAEQAQGGRAHQARLAGDDDGDALQGRARGSAGGLVRVAQGVEGDQFRVAGGLVREEWVSFFWSASCLCLYRQRLLSPFKISRSGSRSSGYYPSRAPRPSPRPPGHSRRGLPGGGGRRGPVCR